MNLKTIKKAVFPVAGLGTRFLPATKAMPKEMLPIVDKPLIQYAVEEAIEAGIEELILTDFVKVNGISNAKVLKTRLSQYNSMLVDKLELPNRHPDSKYFDLD